jgi:hypothetical protein
MEYLTVISVDHSDVVAALKSSFSDFEDGLQHFSAMRNQCGCIVTRNSGDYKNSKIAVYSPMELLSLYIGKL